MQSNMASGKPCYSADKANEDSNGKESETISESFEKDLIKILFMIAILQQMQLIV